MGCCGCSNKSSAITAGIFGLIQGLIGVILNAYFLNLYCSYPYHLSPENIDERLFLLYATVDVYGPILILLGIATFLHCIWIISSVVLLIGNANNNACCVRQWVIITAFVIIGDILLPIAALGLTIGSFISVVENFGRAASSDTLEQVVGEVYINFYKYYIIFILSFSKLSLITIISNICLNVFTNRRASEIGNVRGYVIGTSVTILQGQTVLPSVVHVGPAGSTFPAQFHGVANPHYTGNIALQPATNFQVPTASYEQHEHATDPLRDDQKDPLLPPNEAAFNIR